MNNMWDDIIEEWLLIYSKCWPKETKEEFQKKLYFYLKLKYKDNKDVEEEYNQIIQRVNKKLQKI